jgi:hypothetical protein
MLMACHHMEYSPIDIMVHAVCPVYVVTNLNGEGNRANRVKNGAVSAEVSGQTLLSGIEGKRDADVGKPIIKIEFLNDRRVQFSISHRFTNATLKKKFNVDKSFYCFVLRRTGLSYPSFRCNIYLHKCANRVYVIQPTSECICSMLYSLAAAAMVISG